MVGDRVRTVGGRVTTVGGQVRTLRVGLGRYEVG